MHLRLHKSFEGACVHLQCQFSHALFGRGGKVEQWRNGSLLRVLADDKTYSYDNPVFHPIDPPVTLEAGDELKMFCKFKSKSRQEATYYGEGTSDEMCFAFLLTYPRNDFRSCPAFGPMDMCLSDEKFLETQLNDNLWQFGCDGESAQPLIAEVVANATELCGYGEDAVCTPECRDFFQNVYKEESCFRNGLQFYFENIIRSYKIEEATQGLKLLQLCDKEILPVYSRPQYYDKSRLMTAGADMTTSGFALVFFMAIFVLNRDNQ